MAEIEPISGAPGTPGELQATEVAPVSVDAVATDGPLVSGGSSRPKGLVRWGVALLTLAVMIGVVSVAAALLAAGATSSAIQGWLPKSTVAYLEIRADLPGDQRAKAGDLLAKFPGFADQSSLDAKIDEALQKVLEGSGVSWTADVKPWLAGEVGVAVTSAAFDLAATPNLGANGLNGVSLGKAPDDGAVLLVAVKDAAAAKAWVSKEVGGTQATQTYAGGEITIVTGTHGINVAYTVRSNVLILGPEKTVKAALDTGGSSPVATSESFTAARKSAPAAYLGFGYLDLKAFVDASLAAAGDKSGLPKACLDQVTGMVPAWAAGSARAEDSALVFETSMPATGSGGSTTKGTPSAIASHLPATTLAAIEVRDLGTRLVSGVDALKKALACEPGTADTIKQVEQALAAVGGVDALVGWAGDSAIAVEFNGGTFGGGLAATVTDEAAASRTLQQVQALLALAGSGAGVSSRTEPYGGGQLLVVTVPSSATGGAAVPEIAATVQNGVFVLGTIDFVKHVVDTSANSSLATTDTYKRAISTAGGDGISDVFVDLAGLRTAAETMIPAAQKARYDTEVKPFLVPFEAFASVAEAPGSTTVSRSAITFTK
jgi:hypothetical protein